MGAEFALAAIRQRRVPLVRLVFYVTLAAAFHWMDIVWLDVVLGLLVARLLWHDIVSLADPVAGIRKELSKPATRDREVAIFKAQELATDKARDLLLEHLTVVNASADKEELLAIFRALIDGWGLASILEVWGALPAQSRVNFLEFARGNANFAPLEVLQIARHGMNDVDEQLARKAWHAYATTVTSGFERPEKGFDIPGWIQSSAADPNTQIQELRRGLVERRSVEVQQQGVESLVARYRREVFIAAQPSAVRLHATCSYQFETEDNGQFQLLQGLYEGTLGGRFDNAQNAMAEGWTLCIELDAVQGRAWNLAATWHSLEFYSEVLDARHDDQRLWQEEAPKELTAAFSNHPFVGPVVAYGDAWDALEPSIDGQRLQLEQNQLLKCLIALDSGAQGEGTSLLVLLYAVEGTTAEHEDELRPFVTRIPLERWLLAAARDERIDPPSIR